jgi:hypothetical protein
MRISKEVSLLVMVELLHRLATAGRSLMSASRTSSLRPAVAVAFDAGQITSDGGLVWLAQADDRQSLSPRCAAQLH